MKRSPLQGTAQIVRYNWSFYLAGLVAIAAGLALLRWVLLPGWVATLVWMGLGLAGWWWLASLVVSYWVYDASGLMNWRWLDGLVGAKPAGWVNLNAGLDESTPELAAKWGEPTAVLDFFDAKEMTEASILRARLLAGNVTTPEGASYRRLPLGDGTVPLAMLLFAAHELRSPAAREAFFCELLRVLEPGGRLVLVEHVRDCANFMAFGPGFLHFMPRSEWFRLARHAGFHVARDERKTPFVRALVLEKP